MARYRRFNMPGACYFFTVLTQDRRPVFRDAFACRLLLRAWRETEKRLPFETIAFSILPGHIHCIWRLPEDDADFSARWASVKARLTFMYKKRQCVGGLKPTLQGATASQRRQCYSGLWQKRFWEHIFGTRTICGGTSITYITTPPSMDWPRARPTGNGRPSADT